MCRVFALASASPEEFYTIIRTWVSLLNYRIESQCMTQGLKLAFRCFWCRLEFSSQLCCIRGLKIADKLYHTSVIFVWWSYCGKRIPRPVRKMEKNLALSLLQLSLSQIYNEEIKTMFGRYMCSVHKAWSITYCKYSLVVPLWYSFIHSFMQLILFFKSSQCPA